MSGTIRKPRKSFSLEYKQEAAKLVLEQGYTQEKAAESLGVSLSAIGRWVRAERNNHPYSSSTPTKSRLTLSEHEELKQLRKQNKELLIEREILKKAAGIEANETK